MSHSKLIDDIIEEYGRARTIPVDLVQRAWAQQDSREKIIEMLLWSLRKLGGFEKVPFWMEAISSALPLEMIIELYSILRNRSVRNELEWRLPFQASFPSCKGLLPPVQEHAIRSSEHLDDYLVKATEENDIEAVALMIECMLRIGLNPCAVRIATLDDLGLSEDELQEMAADELEALIKKVNKERGILIRDYAVQLGHERIVQLLEGLCK